MEKKKWWIEYNVGGMSLSTVENRETKPMVGEADVVGGCRAVVIGFAERL